MELAASGEMGRRASVAATGMLGVAVAGGVSRADEPCPSSCDLGVYAANIGDMDGDGVSDVAVCDPMAGVVEIFGGDGSLLCRLTAPMEEGLFGFAVFPVCDVDGDGFPEIAVASLTDYDQEFPGGIIHLYSVVKCKEVAYLKNVDGVAAPAVSLVGDLDGDGTVGYADLLMLLAGLGGEDLEADPYALDVNADGVVDFADAVELLGLEGTQAVSACEASVAALVSGSESLLNDPMYTGVLGACGEVLSQGPIGCLICAIRCGSHMKKAAECVFSQRRRIAELCDPLADQGRIFEYTECFREQRLATTRCLQDVAGAAGSCGSCIYKCFRAL